VAGPDGEDGTTRADAVRWILAGALAWGLLATADLLVEPAAWRHAEGTRALSAALGLGLACGVLQGALLAVLRRGVRSLAPRRAFAVWIVPLSIAALWVARRTSLWAELHGPQRAGAAVLAVGLAIGVLVLAWLTSVDPSRASRSTRRAWAIAVAIAVGGSVLADRTLMPGEVPAVHLALRVVAAWALMLGIDGGLGRLPPVRRSAALALAVGIAIAIAIPIRSLDASHRLALGSLVDRPFAALALAFVRALGDRDRDGHAAWLGGGDCAPDDPHVHPGAPEVPDNGVDDNCVLGDASARTVDAREVPVPDTPSPMNVVLVTIDTLSAAHTSLYGYERATTPSLDAWAKDAVVFERAYTSGGWTGLAIPSCFRGVYARRLPWALLHRTSTAEPPHPPAEGGPRPFAAFPVVTEDAPPPLAWWLARRGMTTAAIVDDGATMVLSPELRTDIGFSRFESLRPTADTVLDDTIAIARARERLAALAAGPPFFLWVHLYGPHAPSETHAGVPEFGSAEVDRYDHEIAATDRALADLLADTDALPGRPTLVVVTADHGEDIENGQRFHGTNVRESVIRVPLVMKAPGLAPRRDMRVASLVDVMPTILAATSTPGPAGLDGIDLLARDGSGGDPARIVITDTWRVGADGTRTTDISAALDGEYAVQLLLGPRAWSAFDQREAAARPVDRWGEAQVDDLEHALLDYLEHAASP
jgi:hypothetical protein